ncbi:unnamed protein product [Lupinus luteus]|uniref:Uncharacterized protein n=1 Tax=Lupinus luteus TaxID=3873 RepID=A0AAV1W189_LUPLU
MAIYRIPFVSDCSLWWKGVVKIGNGVDLENNWFQQNIFKILGNGMSPILPAAAVSNSTQTLSASFNGRTASHFAAANLETTVDRVVVEAPVVVLPVSEVPAGSASLLGGAAVIADCTEALRYIFCYAKVTKLVHGRGCYGFRWFGRFS